MAGLYIPSRSARPPTTTPAPHLFVSFRAAAAKNPGSFPASRSSTSNKVAFDSITSRPPQKFRAELFSLTLAASDLFTRSPMNNTHPNPDSPDSTLPAISPRQLAARRANALKSTGPRTSKGKEIARQNSLKHGFFSCDVVNAVLDGPARLDEFTTMLNALLAEYDPQSVRERILIDEVAASCWRIRRILRYECRETWSDDDEDRRAARTESPSEAIAAAIGYDHQGARERTFR